MVPSLRKVMLLVVVAVSCPFPSSSYGSGSYLSRPPQPSLIDSEKYELGKAVFLGRIQGTSTAASLQVTQAQRLRSLQSGLPVKARQSAKLPDLAGKLSEAQMNALEYYLKVRFKVTLR